MKPRTCATGLTGHAAEPQARKDDLPHRFARGGGFDQGLLLGADYAARGFRVIAPSRPGYLRTPFPANGDASGETAAQARAAAPSVIAERRLDFGIEHAQDRSRSGSE